MATDKYLNLTGLTEVASKVNQKLRKVSIMPSAPLDGDIVMYIGFTTQDYIMGCAYRYNSTSAKWEQLDTSVVLNGTDKTGDEASFYAPEDSGTLGQVVVSNGPNTAPSWASFSGYCPTIIDNDLYFYYGILPEVENTSIVFEID